MTDPKAPRPLDGASARTDLSPAQIHSMSQLHDALPVSQSPSWLHKRQFMHPLAQTTPQESLPPTPPPLRPSVSQVQLPPLVPTPPVMSPLTQGTLEQPLSAQQSSLPAAVSPKRKKQKSRTTRGERLLRLFGICSILTIIAVVFMSQANGAAGAWTADAFRAVFGPRITAQIEMWYLGLSDTTHQMQYKLSGQPVKAPWAVGTTTPMPTATASAHAVPLAPMPLDRIPAIVTPAIDGEGVWIPQGMAPSPYQYLPLDAKAFIRPDPSHPYAIVTLLQFDMRFFRLHMVAGTTEPGGPRGIDGPGVIPAVDQRGDSLLAAFNGGFKYADGQYGLKTNGIVYVPPQPDAATIAMTKNGQILLGAWGADPRLNSANQDLVAWRQNAALLINNGVINPLTQDGAAWGGTILNSAYTWRSAIGITAHSTLLYAAGDSVTALTLGEALRAAGAVMAMQTDINPFWVRAFLYSHDSHGTLNIIKLNPAMHGTGTEYLYGTERDFFYLTRFAPSPPVHTRETIAQ